MSQSLSANSRADYEAARGSSTSRLANILGTTVFVSLVCSIVLTAIPYGTSQPWWKAAFVCIIFILVIFWLVEGTISQSWFGRGWTVTLPLAALACFALLQTLPLKSAAVNPETLSIAPWTTISADPYQTRFFSLQVLALMMAAILLFRYAVTERRLRIMMNLIIGVAVVSAFFGILRQTTQHSVGFGLPLLVPDSGYAQFINYNHFAYLMEMALGLILGLLLGGGIRREQTLIYVAALLPIWIGLVLCNSRGGLIAMLAQVIITALLFGLIRKVNPVESRSRIVKAISSLPVRLALIVLLITGIIFGTVWLGGDQLANKIEGLRAEFTRDDLHQGVSRNEMWTASWHLFAAHPILGVGMGGYWAVIPAFHNASGTMTPQEAHNDYLELLASGGVVGLVLVAWFAVVVCRKTFQNLQSANRFRRAACYGAAVGIAGVAVHSLVDFGLHTIVNALTFTTLIVIATSKPHWANEPTRTHE